MEILGLDLSEFSEMSTILGLIVVALLKIIYDILKTELPIYGKKRKIRKKWVDFLNYNPTIRCCTHDFKNKVAISTLSVIIGIIMGIFLVVLIYLFILIVTGYELLGSFSMAVTSLLVFVVIYLAAVIIFNRSVQKIKSIADVTDTLRRLDVLFSTVFCSGMIIIIFMLYTIAESITKEVSITYSISFSYFVTLVFLLISIFYLDLIQKNLIHKLKSMLLENYREDFPCVYVKTETEELKGNIQDIFNDEFIIFNYNGLKIPVEWYKITSIKLSEKETNDIDIQYAIAESLDENGGLKQLLKKYLNLFNTKAMKVEYKTAIFWWICGALSISVIFKIWGWYV